MATEETQRQSLFYQVLQDLAQPAARLEKDLNYKPLDLFSESSPSRLR